jgi:hypothetical protein
MGFLLVLAARVGEEVVELVSDGVDDVDISEVDV